MASGLCHATRTALFRLAFAPAPALPCLNLAARHNSQAHSTKGTPPPPRGRDILPVLGFRFYFTPLAGVLFTFPSRYSFAIGSRIVFSLGSWSTRIQAGFLVPRPTQAAHHEVPLVSRTRLSRSPAGLPMPFRYGGVFSQLHGTSPCAPTTPRSGGLGSSAFARRYSRNLS